MRRWEILLWCLATLALAAIQLIRTSGPRLSHDSYQYLNIAGHLASDGTARTSMVHFDDERAQGCIPAPVNHFPIGYPALLAGVHLLGMNLGTAAVAVSTVSLAGVTFLIAVLAGWLGFHVWETRLALFLWCANSHVPELSVSVITEPVFMLVMLGAIALLVKGEMTGRGIEIAAAGVLTGLTYWLRYAGLLLVAAVGLYGAFRILQNRQRKFWLAALAATGAIVGAGMLRSLLQTGVWQAGDKRDRLHPVLEVLRTFVRAIHHVLLGDGTVFWLGLFVLSGGVLVAALLVITNRSGRVPWFASFPAPLWFLGVAYSVGMFYLGIVSTISFGSRMFFPLLPVLVLWISACAVAAARMMTGPTRRRALLAAFVVSTAGYVWLNARSLAQPLAPAPHEGVALWLGRPMENGLTVRQWMERHLAPGQTLVASEGQALAYVTGYPVVSLVGNAFSAQRWEEDAVRGVMQHYSAPYLVVFPFASPDQIPVQSQSALLARLSHRGRADTPEWLNLVADNGMARVFYCAGCAATVP